MANLKDSLEKINAKTRLFQPKVAGVKRTNPTPEKLLPASATACHELIRYLMKTVFESCVNLEKFVADRDAMKDQLVAQTDTYLKKEMQDLGRRGDISLVTFVHHSPLDDVVLGSFESSCHEQELDETKVKPTIQEAQEVITISSSSEREDDETEDDESMDDSDSDYVEGTRGTTNNGMYSGVRQSKRRTSPHLFLFVAEK